MFRLLFHSKRHQKWSTNINSMRTKTKYDTVTKNKGSRPNKIGTRGTEFKVHDPTHLAIPRTEISNCVTVCSNEESIQPTQLQL